MWDRLYRQVAELKAWCCFISFYFPVSTESLLSSAVNVLDWITMLLPRQSFFFFFFLYILLYFFVCSVVVSSPPKTFEQLYMKCVVVALVVVVLLFDIIGCVQTSCALRVAFKNPFQVSFLCLPLGKRLTGATLFFSFSPELYKCGVQVQEGADCTHTNYDPRCLWALYPVFTFYLWAKRRWLYPSGSR